MKKSIKYFKYSILNFVILNFAINIFAQNTFLLEKYYIHTDRKNYIAGETIQFKIYPLIKKEVETSTVIYINIVNSNGEPVEYKTIAFTENGAIGSIKIPEELNTGYYTLYAYTKWQRNFGQQNYAKKELFIINSQKEVYYNSNKTKDYNLFFSPIGGTLQEGKENKVVFCCKNKFGDLIPVEGQILNQKNALVTSFNSNSDGIGFFLINPLSDSKYKAIIKIDNQTYIFDLPPINHAIAEFLVDDTNNNILTLGWSDMVNPYNNNDSLNLEINYNGMSYIKLFEGIPPEKFIITIPKSNLIKGLNRIILKNNRNEILYEHFVFIKPDEIPSLSVKLDKPQYKKREQVNVSLKLLSNSIIQPNSNLSVSVARMKNQNDSLDNHILHNDLLEKYFTTVQTPNKILDLTFFPEIRGSYLSGEIFCDGKDSNLKMNLFVTILDSIRTTRIVTTDSIGKFLILLNGNLSGSEVLIQLNKETPNYKIKLDSNFETHFQSNNFSIPKFTEPQMEYFRRLMLNYQVSKNYYEVPENKQITNSNLKELFYGKYDYCYYLSKYIDLPTIEEVFNNIILNVNAKKNGNKFSLIVYDKYKQHLNLPPLVLVDGIPILELESLMNTHPSKIEKIEIINSNYLIGEKVFGGVISFFSKEKNIAGVSLPASSQIINYQMDNNPIKNRNYSASAKILIDKHIPDLRNTLYWNPNIITNENGNAEFSFSTSDETGKFIIQIAGITNEGNQINDYCIFEVKNN